MGLLNHQICRVVLSLCGCGLAGCNMGKSSADTSYPTAPPSAQSQQPTVVSSNQSAAPVAPTAIKIPADAQELSHGDYPPPAFTIPNQAGQILVVDMDGDPTVAVASTSVDGKDSGKQMSITDVTNMSVSMNKLHRYRIVFVPK